MQSFAAFEPSAEEGQAIAECLQNYGGLTEEISERLLRFQKWSDSYEEIPCFTKCYLSKMFDIYNETAGFIEQRVRAKFGNALLEVCRHHLFSSTTTNSCQLAYKGLHCLITVSITMSCPRFDKQRCL